MGFFNRISTLATIGALAAFAVQQFPGLAINAEIFGAPIAFGILVHVALIGFLIEARKGEGPRVLALVPLLAYGGYYIVYAWEEFELRRQDAQLARDNPGQVMTFDPNRFSLISDEAGALVERFDIPAAYSPPKAHQSADVRVHLLLPPDRCGIPPARSLHERRRTADGSRHPCHVSFPATPPQPAIEFVRIPQHVHTDLWQNASQVIDMRADGKLRARYTVKIVRRLSAFPFLMAGCGWFSAPPKDWACLNGFYTKPFWLNGRLNPSSSHGTTPEEVMLGLRHLKDAQRDKFRLDPRTAVLLDANRSHNGKP